MKKKNGNAIVKQKAKSIAVKATKQKPQPDPEFNIGDIVGIDNADSFGVVEAIHHTDLIVRTFIDRGTDKPYEGGVYSNCNAHHIDDCKLTISAERLAEIRDEANTQAPNPRPSGSDTSLPAAGELDGPQVSGFARHAISLMNAFEHLGGHWESFNLMMSDLPAHDGVHADQISAALRQLQDRLQSYVVNVASSADLTDDAYRLALQSSLRSVEHRPIKELDIINGMLRTFINRVA